jgi:hypothetical protein
MTVKRYRDAAAMPPPPPGTPHDPATFARIRELWQFSSRLVPSLFRPGLYRYRSIEDSTAARDRATIERMRALRETRKR